MKRAQIANLLISGFFSDTKLHFYIYSKNILIILPNLSASTIYDITYITFYVICEQNKKRFTKFPKTWWQKLYLLFIDFIFI